MTYGYFCKIDANIFESKETDKSKLIEQFTPFKKLLKLNLQFKLHLGINYHDKSYIIHSVLISKCYYRVILIDLIRTYFY